MATCAGIAERPGPPLLSCWPGHGSLSLFRRQTRVDAPSVVDKEADMEVQGLSPQAGTSLGEVHSTQRPLFSLERKAPLHCTWGLAYGEPGSWTNRNIDSCQVRRLLKPQVCFSLMVWGIIDSLLIQTGLQRVFHPTLPVCFEHRFGKWLTREIHIWVRFKD